MPSKFPPSTALTILVALLLSLSIGSGEARSQANRQLETGILGTGVYQTRWYRIDSGQPGPTVLITGGVHGNEPAGYRAADQIRHWKIVRGKLIVIPQVNRLGLAANTRWLPEFRNDNRLRDLNRNFPVEMRKTPATPLAEFVWAFVEEQNPDWVFDLHEGFDFRRQNERSVGSSVIAFPDQAGFAQKLVRTVNADIADQRKFMLLAGSGPAKGSLARACTEQLGSKSFILETTFKQQDLSTRNRQHRILVSTALQEIGLIQSDQSRRLAPPRQTDLVRIAVFDGQGANEKKVVAALENHPTSNPSAQTAGIATEADLFVTQIGPGDVRTDILSQFDIVIFPGGSASKQANSIGPVGQEAVRSFVKQGGGYIGICAGAYLCSSHYRWSFDLMNAAVFNKMVDIPGKGRKSMWYRGGPTKVKVEFAESGKNLFGLDGIQSVQYQNGPIISPGQRSDLPAYEVLASFRTENGIYKAQKNTMIGAPAIVRSQYGGGRVLAISPHFESTKGKEFVLRKAVELVQPRP